MKRIEKVLVTGATGTVGNAIVNRLVADGRAVSAFVRNADRASSVLPESVTLVTGDIADESAVAEAVGAVDVVFHSAGMPEQWLARKSGFQSVNVGGTRNVVRGCMASGIRLAYTSTIDVFAWTPGEPFDESKLDPHPRPTAYERSKQDADRIVSEAVEHGLDAVFLHPSAVYGQAPAAEIALNKLILDLASEKVPVLMKGGLPPVHADDVAKGHLTAAATADAGSRFILAGDYMTLTSIAEVVRERRGTRVPPALPMWMAAGVAFAGEGLSKITRRPPMVARGEQVFLASHPVPVSSRAQRELAWESRPFEIGVEQTLEHFAGKLERD
ncbi:MAG: SDR family NAD(P)-dependent oxidoreductase [Solirubrobacterales bacterium]